MYGVPNLKGDFTMTITTNAPSRKELVKAISAHLDTDAVYVGPTSIAAWSVALRSSGLPERHTHLNGPYP